MLKPILSLVGAGPGDPDLITLKAIKTLRSADVVLYDALANEELLEYVRPDAIKKFVGKRFGCHALSQSEINMQIISYSRRSQMRSLQAKSISPNTAEFCFKTS